MASLTAHLRQPGDHGRLGFHPECPLCRRERLAGRLGADAIVGRGAQAMLTAGVLVLSSATPTAALATEPDQEHEGATAPDHVAVNAPPSTPGVDPGGNSTDLPFTAAPPAAAQAPSEPAGGTGPIEQETATNEEAPIADPGDGTDTDTVSQEQAPPMTSPVTAPATTAPAPTQPTTDAVPGPATAAPTAPALPTDPASSAPVPATSPTTHMRPDRDTTAPSGADRREAAPKSVPTAQHAVPATLPTAAVVSPSADRATATVQVTQSQSGPSSSAAVSHGEAAQRGDRFHVVQRGESLWSIAKDLLGEDASAARIAREVNRLWGLNRDRIGTGDPDLLIAGTRLVLR
jgi:hypothetical protein